MHPLIKLSIIYKYALDKVKYSTADHKVMSTCILLKSILCATYVYLLKYEQVLREKWASPIHFLPGVTKLHTSLV